MVTESESSLAGMRIATDSDPGVDPDAPDQPSAETQSAKLRRAFAVVIGEALAKMAGGPPGSGRPPRRGLTVVVASVVAAFTAAGGYFAADRPDRPGPGKDCDPTSVRYIMHMADAGENLAEEMDRAGLTEQATLVREMVSPATLPRDLQLCVLLSEQVPDP